MDSKNDRSQLVTKILERVSPSRFKRAILMEMNRGLLALLLLLLIFIVLFIIGLLDPGLLRGVIRSKEPIETFFQSMVAAIITGVTLVVTISQVVLSQELGSLGDQQERMENSMNFRKEAESHINEPLSPTSPSLFFVTLLQSIKHKADLLSDTIQDDDDDSLVDDFEEFIKNLIKNSKVVKRGLEDKQFGTYKVINHTLDFNYPFKIYEVRRLKSKFGSNMSKETEEILDDMIETFKLYGSAREHFKTLYFQWELINLSRIMLYSAIPAILTATTMILFFNDPGSFTGTTMGIDNILILVTVSVTISLAPFMLLTSYILRITTLAKRTLAIGPFILRETEQE